MLSRRSRWVNRLGTDLPPAGALALVAFTGVSGAGKSSLVLPTLHAEAQRRYLESVAPDARRLFRQLRIPDVDEIDGIPPAAALQQQRGRPTTRSSVGSVTTQIGRDGTIPARQRQRQKCVSTDELASQEGRVKWREKVVTTR